MQVRVSHVEPASAYAGGAAASATAVLGYGVCRKKIREIEAVTRQDCEFIGPQDLLSAQKKV